MAAMDDSQFNDEGCCLICLEDISPPIIHFVPCSHTACSSCVRRMRVATVYKADKGVSCPFCRTTIESFSDSPPAVTTPTNKSHDPVLKNATIFKIAGVLISDETVKIMPFGRSGVLSIGGVNDYRSPKGVIGQSRLFSVHNDKLPETYIVPPLKPNANLLAMATDRIHARHLTAYMAPGAPNRVKLAKQLLEILSPVVEDLAVHPSSNYVVQSVLEYCQDNRNLLEGPNASPVTALFKKLCAPKCFMTIATDQKGNFVLQRMILCLKGTEELNLVLGAIRGHLKELAVHPFGGYVVERLLEIQVNSLMHPSARSPRIPTKAALGGLAAICSEMTSEKATATMLATHPIASLHLIESLRWSLPHPTAFQSALRVARMAAQLALNRTGVRTLQGLLSLSVSEVDWIVGTDLQAMVSSLLSDPILGTRLLKCAMAAATGSNEYRTLIVDSLVNLAEQQAEFAIITQYLQGINTLSFALSLLPDQDLEERLQRLQQRASPSVFQTLNLNIKNHRESVLINPTLPPSLLKSLNLNSHGPSSADSSLSPNGHSAPSPSHTPEPYSSSPLLKFPKSTSLPAPSLLGRQPSPVATSSITSDNSRSNKDHTREQGEKAQPRLCTVCDKNLACMLLLNCAHLCACADCTPRLSSCPLCHAHIHKTIRVQLTISPESGLQGAPPSLLPYEQRPASGNSNKSASVPTMDFESNAAENGRNNEFEAAIDAGLPDTLDDWGNTPPPRNSIKFNGPPGSYCPPGMYGYSDSRIEHRGMPYMEADEKLLSSIISMLLTTG